MKVNKKNLQKDYDNLINLWKAKSTEELSSYEYLEKHHILPKCLGGNDEPDNIVKMDVMSHLEAHILLSKINPSNLDLAFAVNSMLMSSTCTNKRAIELEKIDSKTFIEARQNLSRLQKGKYFTDEHRKHLRKPKRFINNIDTETRSRLASKSKKGRHYGTRVLDKNTGTIYCSLEEAAKAFGYSPSTIRYWIRNIPERGLVEYVGEGHEIKRDYSFSSHKVVGPDGIIYSSIHDCSKRTGHQRKTITNWIKNNPEKGFRFL